MLPDEMLILKKVDLSLKKKEIVVEYRILYNAVSIGISNLVSIVKKLENLENNDSRKKFKSCRRREIDEAVLK